LDALVGLGYDFAWQGRFVEEERTFRAALDVAPDNPGAANGFAYTYLWSTRHPEGLETLERIEREQPHDPNPSIRIGVEVPCLSGLNVVIETESHKEYCY
jgi:hypothetical protein